MNLQHPKISSITRKGIRIDGCQFLSSSPEELTHWIFCFWWDAISPEPLQSFWRRRAKLSGYILFQAINVVIAYSKFPFVKNCFPLSLQVWLFSTSKEKKLGIEELGVLWRHNLEEQLLADDFFFEGGKGDFFLN